MATCTVKLSQCKFEHAGIVIGDRRNAGYECKGRACHPTVWVSKPSTSDCVLGFQINMILLFGLTNPSPNSGTCAC